MDGARPKIPPGFGSQNGASEDDEEAFSDDDEDLFSDTVVRGLDDMALDPGQNGSEDESSDSQDDVSGLEDRSDDEDPGMEGIADGTDDLNDTLDGPDSELSDPEDEMDDVENKNDDLDDKSDDQDDRNDDLDDGSGDLKDRNCDFEVRTQGVDDINDDLEDRHDDHDDTNDGHDDKKNDHDCINDDLDDMDDDLDDGDGSGDQESDDGGGSSGEEGAEPRGPPPPPPEPSSELDQQAAHLSRELYRGYRLLRQLMSPEHHQHNRLFMHPVDSSQKELWDYDSIVKNPIWLRKIRERLLAGEYSSLKDLFSDLRLMFRNCYRYNGPQHAVTRRALRLEQLMEQLIEQMEPDLRAQCTLEATEGPEATVDAAVVSRRRSARAKKPTYFSHVLHWVRHERAERDKEYRRQQLEAKREQRGRKEARFEDWERRLLGGGAAERLRCMWEFPQLTQFVHLSLRALNVMEVPLYEMERMLLVPQSSETLAVLMTSLVSPPLVRAKLANMPPMPYHVWTAKLAARVTLWYRAYVREKGSAERLLETQGIEPLFWQLFGPKNPFKRCLFHHMSYVQRVWMIKTMCDHLFHSHKSLQDCVMEVSEAEPRETVVGRDRHGFEYLHFPQLLVRDVRLYRRRPWRAPADWSAPPPPAASPPRLVAAGQRWTKSKLRKLQKKLLALRKRHVAAAPRAAAARHACLRPVTPGGSEDGESGEEQRLEEADEVADPADDAGGRQDDDWRAPARLSSGVGRGRGRRKGRAPKTPAPKTLAPKTPAPKTPAPKTPAKKQKGRGKKKHGASAAAPASARAPPTPTPSKPPLDENACQYCGISVRSQRARNAHRCFQKQVALQAAEEQEVVRTPRGRRTARRSPTPPPSSSQSEEEEDEDSSAQSSDAEEEEPGVTAEDESLLVSLVDEERGRVSEESSAEPETPTAGDESRIEEDDRDSRMEGMEEDLRMSDGGEDGVGEDSRMSDGEDSVMDVTEADRAVCPASIPPSDASSDGGNGADTGPPVALTNGVLDTPAESPVAGDGEMHTKSPPVEDGDSETPTESPPVAGDGEMPTKSPPVEDGDSETPTESPAVAGDGEMPTKSPPVEDGDSETPTESPAVAGDDSETPTESPPVAGDGEMPTKSPPVEDGDSETPTESPAVAGDGEMPTKSPPVEDGDSETPTESPAVAGDGSETPTESPAVAGDGEMPTKSPPVEDGDSETPTESPVAAEGGKLNGLPAGADSWAALGGGRCGSVRPAGAAGDGRASAVAEEAAGDVPGPRGDAPPARSPPEGGAEVTPAQAATEPNDVSPGSAKDVEGAANSDGVKSAPAESKAGKDAVKAEPDDLKLVTGGLKTEDRSDVKPSENTKPEPVSLRSDLTAVKPDPDSADIKPAAGAVTGAALKSEPSPAAPTDPAAKFAPNGALQRGEAAAAAADLPQLPAPQPIPEPAEVPPLDTDHFQLVADSFDSLRRLIIQFSPSHAGETGRKKSKQPHCEVELHAELKKILEELEPLEAKINMSVRRMRKRLCQEYLDFLKRPGDYRDPGESVWREPGDPEPAPRGQPPPPPPPPPPEEEDSCDETGRRRQRSRAAKRKLPPNNYRQPERLGERCGRRRQPAAATSSSTPQLSSRGRLRKVRKMDDFAYDEDDTLPSARRERDASQLPPGSASAQTAAEEVQLNPQQLQQLQQRATPRLAGPGRVSAAVEPSPAWNSALALLGAARPVAAARPDPRPGRGRAAGPPPGRILQRALTVRQTPPARLTPRPAVLPRPAPATLVTSGVVGSTVVPSSGKRRFVVRMGSNGKMFMEQLSGVGGGAAVVMGSAGQRQDEQADADDPAADGETPLAAAGTNFAARPVEVQPVHQLPLDHADLVFSSAASPVRPLLPRQPLQYAGPRRPRGRGALRGQLVQHRIAPGGGPRAVPRAVRPPIGSLRPAGAMVRVVRPAGVASTVQFAGATTRIVIGSSSAPVSVHNLVQYSTTASTPALAPAVAPTLAMASAPTLAPAPSPTPAPTLAPTLAPILAPILAPAPIPTLTTAPAPTPTLAPTAAAATAPTAAAATASNTAPVPAAATAIAIGSLPYEPDVAAKVAAVMRQLQSMNVVLTNEKAQQVAVKILAEARRKKLLAGSPTVVSAATVSAAPVVAAVSAPVGVGAVRQSVSMSPGAPPRRIPCYRPVPTSTPRMQLVRRVVQQQPAAAAAAGSDPLQLAMAVSGLSDLVPTAASAGQAKHTAPVSAVGGQAAGFSAAPAVTAAVSSAAFSPAVTPSKVQPSSVPPAPAVGGDPASAGGAAPPAKTAAPAAKQGKIVMVRRGGEQKLCIQLANGQLVELSSTQASTVRQEAQRRKHAQGPAGSAAQQ